MELIAQIPLIGTLLTVILPFVVVLGIVVSVHEYGHYIVGRWCGIHAEVFSLGFGKVVWSRMDKRGTKWQIAAMPLGGYVKFLGDADAASRSDTDLVENMDKATLARSFPGASLGRKFLTVLAGPVFNFILSVVVFSGLIMWQGDPSSPIIGEVAAVPGEPLPFEVGDLVNAVNGQAVATYWDMRSLAAQADPLQQTVIDIVRGGRELRLEMPFLMLPLVGDLLPLSPAAKAGLQRGDYIIAANDIPLANFLALQKVVRENPLSEVNLSVWRDGQTLEMSLTPEKSVLENAEGGLEERVVIGVDSGFPVLPQTVAIAPWTAAYYGVERVGSVISSSFNAIGHIVTGKISAANLQGPIGIAQVSGEMATKGLFDFIALIGFVSTAIGMMNLFPVPVLDGGHLVMFAYEAVRGRPPSKKAMEVAMSVGLAMVLLLMLFATYNDIMRL